MVKLNFLQKKIISNVRSNFLILLPEFLAFIIRIKKTLSLSINKRKIKSNKKNELFVENANSFRDFLEAEKVVNIIYKVYKKK